jgi:DNA replication and repair protein RecF
MRVTQISLEHFRNIELTRLAFDPDRPTFFVGDNGQGKSNLLEALGLLTAIRSFRTHELGPLIQRQKRSARVYYRLCDEQNQEIEVELRLSARKRSILFDGSEVKRLSDYVGLFPSVVFSADDTQLIKSGPQGRRRFFDLLYSVIDTDYLTALQSYHRGLKERNHALKNKMDRSLVTVYDRMLARFGTVIIQKRKYGCERFSLLFESAYLRIASDSEPGSLTYKPALNTDAEEAFFEKLNSNYSRDSAMGTTLLGPHRDDFLFEVHDLGAKTHGSDGQQRSLVLALKLAQIELIEQETGRKPILLLDDILGELDEARKERFWNIFDHQCQVFGSGTSLPSVSFTRQWNVFSVDRGKFTELQ